MVSVRPLHARLGKPFLTNGWNCSLRIKSNPCRFVTGFYGTEGANMIRLLSAALLLTLAACASTPPVAGPSDCAKYGHGSMQCQIEMYSKAGQ
jgi:hypothetical protein